jgi:sterol desaturase/sphingolipid hydroxylase (fatty acid hydroxylase superfamily)
MLYPCIIAGVILEIGWYLLVRRRAYPWKETLASTGVFLLRLPARLLLAPLIVAPVSYFAWSHRLFTIPLNTAWGIALLFLGTELAYYGSHRAGHEIRWMWASHMVHHTPEQIHFASAYRLGPTEVLSGGWLFHLPLFVLGLHPLAVGAMMAVNLFYQFWLHTDIIGRLGPLEWIFNTPSHHRVHHASNAEYLDRNYGGILIVWDRLFGTFAREQPQIPIAYGLAHPIGSMNPIKIALHEWGAMAADVSRARSWRERFRQLFGRPGQEPTARGRNESLRKRVGRFPAESLA